ncbi:hypothetical protein FRC02_001510 [Tulasnella sp. 418]|nr:hypothetical protein FRC02_001510 [Tulasnella sp. 418]
MADIAKPSKPTDDEQRVGESSTSHVDQYDVPSPSSTKTNLPKVATLALITLCALLGGVTFFIHPRWPNLPWHHHGKTDGVKWPKLNYPHVPLNISQFYNNVAAGPGADFSPHTHGWYCAEHLPTVKFGYDGVEFLLPTNWSDGNPDNVIAKKQLVEVPRDSVGFYREMHILYAGDWIDGESGNRFTFHFEDGSESQVEVSAKNWWTLHWLNQGVIRTPYHHLPGGDVNHNVTQIYHWSAAVPSDSRLLSITLPEAYWPNHLHIFAMTLVPNLIEEQARSAMGNRKGSQEILQNSVIRLVTDAKMIPKDYVPKIRLRRIVPTTKWKILNGVKSYAVEATVVNSLPTLVTPDKHMWIQGPFYLALQGNGFRTVQEGVLNRVMPSDEIKVKIWIALRKGASEYVAGAATFTATDSTGSVVASQSDTWDLSHSFTDSIENRDTPEWWDDAKFGIFIHWSIFSVPAWSPPGWYAAWYWWWMHRWTNEDNGFWRYHRDTYGPDVVYDDFIADFTGAKFNASEWVNLFADAGAKYFVFVTKHHDGFALFDTKDTTHRSSYHLGPRRDFLRELFDAAKAEQPHLYRGTYLTMPEWYNPDAGRTGAGFGDWPGFLAHNAYNDSQLEPYTGHIYGKDYLRDIQLEHMKMLAVNYETEIMWCDIGGPNLTVEFAKEWYPFAESQGRQVVMNNRCGAIPQFDTPEYTKFSSIQTTKWETSEGIDPYCYSYNRRTKDDEYKSAETLLHTLIDIVSKNGNYLLNLGPTGEGEIIEAMQVRVLEVGKWLKHSGDCVYGTTYSFPGAELGRLRFTQTSSRFCIISFDRPRDGYLVIERPIPILKGDRIDLLGAGSSGADLKWWTREGKLVIAVSDEAANLVSWAWAFQIQYDL